MLVRREKSIVIEVYYAEDDEIIAKSVKEYLEQQNCKVTVFGAIVDIKVTGRDIQNRYDSLSNQRSGRFRKEKLC